MKISSYKNFNVLSNGNNSINPNNDDDNKKDSHWAPNTSQVNFRVDPLAVLRVHSAAFLCLAINLIPVANHLFKDLKLAKMDLL